MPEDVHAEAEADATVTFTEGTPSLGPGTDQDALEPGTQVDRYVLEEPLGAGGMGRVYAARDPELDRRIAIKFLHASGDGNEKRERRLRREAQAMAKLSHPNVAAVYDVGSFEGRLFVAMELVDSGNLRDWLKEERETSEILEMFVAAGRGLAAAHRAGIVHRDFKPANVLVGSDGRPRVTDFGLARAHGEGERPDVTEAEDVSVLDSNLTRTGSLLGTPRYMAPEQHRGERAGPAADQFSFCVALYEALHGAAPFDGEDLPALKHAVTSGHMADAPANSSVPGWLRAALSRGLSPDPDDRFATMGALVGALQNTPAARRRRMVMAAGAAVLVGGFAVGAVMMTSSKPKAKLCINPQTRLVGVWDDAQKAAIRAQFSSTKRPTAGALYESFASRLDAYALEWKAAHRDNCTATRVRKEQSEELFDLRSRCLQRRRDSLAQLATLYASKSAKLPHAMEAALGLRPVAECADAKRLRAAYPLPADPSKRLVIERLYADIERGQLLLGTRDAQQALATIERVLSEEHAVDHPPIRAKATYARGRAHVLLSKQAEAERDFRDATQLAARAKDDEIAAESWAQLLSVIGSTPKRFKEAEQMVPMVTAMVLRADDKAVEGHYRLMWSETLRKNGKLAEAVAQARASLAAYEISQGPKGRGTANAHHGISVALHMMGKNTEALKAGLEAKTILEPMYGPDHPVTAQVLYNLGDIHKDLGQWDEALALQKRVLAIFQGAYAPDHIDIAYALNNVAIMQARRRAYRAAADNLQRALVIFIKHVGENHRNVVKLRHNITGLLIRVNDLDGAAEQLAKAKLALEAIDPKRGANWMDYYAYSARLASRQQRHTEAVTLARKALALGKPRLAPTSTTLGFLNGILATAFMGNKDWKAALPVWRRVAQIYAKHPPAKRIVAETGIGLCLLGLGKAKAAVAQLETSLEMAKGTVDADALADTELALSRALVADEQDPDRAVALAERAVAAYASSKNAALVAKKPEAEAWLEELRKRKAEAEAKKAEKAR